MERVRVGIIGCGDLGGVHARRLAAIDGVVVAALCDAAPGAIERVAAGLPGNTPARFTDHRNLLGSPLDAVCIATPDSLHVPQVLDALRAGLHVLCEKPLTLDPAALEAVVEAQHAAQRTVLLSNPRRYDGGVRAMRREVLSGRWGPVRSTVVYACEDWVTPAVGTWRHSADLCPGGYVYDAGMHQMDTLLWCTGLEPIAVRAWSDTRGTAVPLVTWGTGTLTGNVPLTFSFVGDAHGWRENVSIHCDGVDLFMIDMQVYWTPNGKVEPLLPREPSEDADDAFVRLLREGGAPLSEPASVRPVLTLTRAIIDSAAAGREVALTG